MDTLQRLLEEICAEEIEDVLGRTVRKLIRSKKLDGFGVQNRYRAVIDGTQKFTRDVPFAKEALHRQRGDQALGCVRP